MLHHHLGDIGEREHRPARGASRAAAWAAVTQALADGGPLVRRARSGPRRRSRGSRTRDGAVDRRRARVRRGDHGADGHHHGAPADLVPAPAGPPRPARRLRRGHRDAGSRAAARSRSTSPSTGCRSSPARPGFDPQVHGGTIVLAESLDDIEGAFQEAVGGRRRDAAVRRHLHPVASSTTRSRRPGQHVVSMFTQWVPHTWNAEPRARRARGVRRPRGGADGRGRARVRRLGAAPPGHRAVRDGARVRPGRRQHLPRRADGRADVPRAAGRRVRRPADAGARAVPGRVLARTAAAA